MNKNVGHAYINAVLGSQNRRPLFPDQSNILHSLFYARGKKRFILYTTDLGRIRRWQEHESSCLKLDASRRIYIDTCAMTLLSKRPSREFNREADPLYFTRLEDVIFLLNDRSIVVSTDDRSFNDLSVLFFLHATSARNRSYTRYFTGILIYIRSIRWNVMEARINRFIYIYTFIRLFYSIVCIIQSARFMTWRIAEN